MLIDAAAPSVPAKDPKATSWSGMRPWQKVALVGLMAVKLTILVLGIGSRTQHDATATVPAHGIDTSLSAPATTLPPGCPYSGAPFAACATRPAR